VYTVTIILTQIIYKPTPSPAITGTSAYGS